MRSALPWQRKLPGADTRVLLLRFPDISPRRDGCAGGKRAGRLPGVITLTVHRPSTARVSISIDAPHLYDRPGSLYLRYQLSMLILTTLALRAARAGMTAMACGTGSFWRPDVVHARDWRRGPDPAYLAARGHPAKLSLYGA